MSSQTDELKLQEALGSIDKVYELSQNLTPIVPSNFATLKEAAIQKQLLEEVNQLRQLFSSNASLDEKKEEFKELLKAHLEATNNTALSMSAMPNGDLNALYFKLAIDLFQPKNLAELCEIFAITPATHLELELPSLPKTHNREQLREAMSNISNNKEMVLQASNFSEWASKEPCPRTAEEFASFLFAGNSCVSLKRDVLSLTFLEHRNLYRLTKEQRPTLFNALYQRNEWFRALEEDINTYEKNGETPREAIQKLIRGLRLGGERMTGQELAADSSREALGYFYHYLNRVPESLVESIKELNYGGKTLKDVLNDLGKEDCVETAANDLAHILNNQQNDSVLDKRPALNEKELTRIEENYNSLNHEAINLKQECSALPTDLCKELISTITLTEPHELFTLLVNFPEAFYEELLRELNLSQVANPLDVLGQHISEGFFNKEQAIAVIIAILDNKDKFQNHKKLIFHIYKQPNLLHFYLSSLSNGYERFEAVNEKDSNGETVLHRATHKPESLEKLLESFETDEAHLRAVNEKDNAGNTVLLLAADNPESLEKLLALYKDDEARLKAVNEKNMFGNTVLLLAADKPASLEKILESFETDEARLKAVNEKDIYDNTVLHCAADKPASLEKILGSFETDDARLKAVNEKNKFGKTVLHCAANTPASLEKIFRSFSPAFAVKVAHALIRDNVLSEESLPEYLKKSLVFDKRATGTSSHFFTSSSGNESSESSHITDDPSSGASNSKT